MNLNPIEIRKKRRSALIGSAILFILATLNLWKGHIPHCVVLYSLSSTICIMGGFFTQRFIKITNAIGEAITALLLLIVFFITVTPIGLLMRLLKKDPLNKEIDNNRDSYWEKPEAMAGYEKQF